MLRQQHIFHYSQLIKKIVLFIFIAALFICTSNLSAQILTWTPLFITVDDSVTIIYDATQGNAGLVGYTGDVYTHTGVLTTESNDDKDWKYVKTEWGQNTAETKLERIGTNLYRFVIGSNIREYYGIPTGDVVTHLAFVFRSANSAQEGKTADGKDIYVPLGAGILRLEPESVPVFASLNDTIKVQAISSPTTSMFSLYIDDALYFQVEDDTITTEIYANEYGKKWVKFIAEVDGSFFAADSFCFYVNQPLVVEELPTGIIDGITIQNTTSATFSLFAPGKEFVYLIGSFNNWEVNPAYYMKQTPDGSRFWLTITDLSESEEILFQYLVEGSLRIADPYARKLLDGGNDKYISDSTYPNLVSYPVGKTEEIVSVFKTNVVNYEWEIIDFQRPEPKDLVIYELLIRDFIAEHDYATLIDSLGYFERLGINAIELLPVNEFEGNESWGYNPSYYFAPDKYYGPARDLKRFIDECHKRGIAVIQDIVLNHAYSQCALVQLYLNNLELSPWFNVTAPHTDYSWGYDFNHEAQPTIDFVERVLHYWIDEFNIDGYRLDFTRGFTNKSGGSGARDNSRIAILKRIYDYIRSFDTSAYLIIEHLVDDESEKIELGNYGMLLWDNMNRAYSQSAMAYLNDPSRSSDLSGAYYKNRGWTKPHLVTYMESHDEPWLMYKNLLYGRSHAAYNIKNLPIALGRIKLVAAFFFTLPGPKMMWQFGELGYDQELPESGYERTAPKPILWNYYDEPNRRNLYNTIAALIKLRNKYDIFRSTETEVQMRVGQNQYSRRINLSSDTLNVTIIGNFDVYDGTVNPQFQEAGMWYDFFSRDSLEITDTQAPIALNAGEFRIFSDRKLFVPDITTDVRIKNELSKPDTYTFIRNYPNPFNPVTTIQFSIQKRTEINIDIFNITGQKIKSLVKGEIRSAGAYQIVWQGTDELNIQVPSGVYYVRLKTPDFQKIHKILMLQ